MTNQPLSGKVALVTGGGRGIGRAISVELSSNGAQVFVNYSSRIETANETIALCKASGGTAQLSGFDVSDSKAVNEAIESIREQTGRLDILVNNAGITSDGIFLRVKDDDWARVPAVNLTGAFFCARAAAKVMVRTHTTGRIINVGSVVGETGNSGQAAYASSKAGLIGLTKSLAKELASRSITVNCITPGFIETDMTDSLNEALRSELLKSIPLERFGKLAEVAHLVSYLSSEHAGYITGQVIGINGGMYM